MQLLYPILMTVILGTHGQNNCEWGKYGKNCSKDCPTTCIPDPKRNLTHCHKETGKCSEGCVPGWFEDLCDHPCTKNCLRNTCNRQNGICTFGCDGDYTGDFCNSIRGTTATPPGESSTYTSPTTPSESNTETTPDLAAILVPVFLVLVVVIAVVVIILFLYKRKRKRGETIWIIDAVTGILSCWRTTGTDGTTARYRAGEDEPFMAEEGEAILGRGADSPCSFVLLTSGSLEQKIKDVQGVFVETESLKEARVKLETFGHVTLSGVPGEGKTSMALMLGAEYRKQGYELVLVEDAYKVQLSDYLEKGKDVCVIFDDIFRTVSSYMDLSRLKHFLYDLHVHLEQCESRSERRYQRLQQETREEQRKLNQPNIYVIFTAETNTLERAMSNLGGQRIFKSSSDVKLTCTQGEKKALWQKYKHHYGCKVDVKNVFAHTKTNVGFPLECKLFSSCCVFQMHHESFFEKPMFYITNQLRKIISSLDDKSAALILILLCEGQINISQLETEDTRPGNQLDTECARPISQLKTKGVSPDSQLESEGASPDSQLQSKGASPDSQLESEGASQDLEAHLKGVATLVKTSTRQGVAKALQCFCRTFLTEANITAFSHSIMYDVCALVLFNFEPEFILKHCSIKFLLEHVQDQQVDGISVNEHQLVIPFSEAYRGIIADRMADAIASGAFSMYIWHPTWKRREISDKLNHMFTDPTSLSDDIKQNILEYACFTGNKNILKRLLPHCEINRPGLNGWTPVMYAVVAGQIECFDILVESKSDITLCDRNNYNLVHLACQHGHKSTVKHVKKALKKHLSPDLYLNQYINGRGVNDWTPVMCAVAFGKEDILDYLTKKGKTFERKKQNKVDFKLSDIHKNTVLHLACWYGNKSIVESLLPHTDINARDNNGQTPVMCALLSGRKDIFDLLVSKKADLTLTDDDNCNLLHVASRVDDLSLLPSIVPKFDINSRGKHGWTPLMRAAVDGNVDVFQLFLHTVDLELDTPKADLRLKDDNSNNLLHLACHGGNVSIVKLLLPKFDINGRGNNSWTSVMFAADKGGEHVVKLLVSQGADIRLRDEQNNSVLHLACFGGNISIVKYLLACKCTDINCLGSQGRTAIMITALDAKPALFELLLSKKADITLTDDDNNTVLHHACQGGNYSIVNILISKININTSGKHGWTPVMFAAWAGRKDMFELLVKQNADLTLTDDYNDNVLHLACQGGSTAIVKCLVKLGDVNRRGKNNSPESIHAAISVFSGNKDPREGNAPKEDIQSSTSPENDNAICVVGQSGKEATVKQESGYFDINVKGRDDQTPLMRAVCGGDMDVYIFLLSCGADQTLVDKDGHTLLHLAAQHGQLHMVKYIIDSFDINTKDKAGLTPVMTSVASGNVAVFEYLRRRGADLSLVNNAGNDVLKLAREVGCRQILEQLEPAKKAKRFSRLKDTKVVKLFIQAKKNMHLHSEISSEVTGESSSSPNENSNDLDLKQTD
ncbi:uncharacterized protein LOC124117618 isoform X2 [Haliotis rufescens]|nr:uncharacterized protein LOC124117618 isoform X2 [Haliotis rufescens]XP_048249080.1 uncharacterized protein LOC124117618 isoform X2 [Haliotis rufescens]XP_048249081.1 uncharacterized protein LOC124117618 isoform X2 [Haliotis rufescens]